MICLKDFTRGKRAALAIVLIFFAFFAIEYLTPLHSDDFLYGQMGLDFEKHWRHYTGWSGRLVADYASSLILMLPSHILISSVIAFFATANIVLIAAIPTTLVKTHITAFKLFVITALYWVCHTDPGISTFWVVGACNYLVTNFFIALFLWCFLTYRNSDSLRVRAVLFLLALLAGCTNENTTLALFYTFVATCILMRLLHIDFNLRSALLYGVGLALGALVLLLAPGNFARANHPAFRWFKDMSLLDKIWMQINRAKRLYLFSPIYFLIGLSCYKLCQTLDEHKNRDSLIWSLLFLTSSFAAFVVMVGSPSMPPRAYSGVFFFLLISLSFVLDCAWAKGYAAMAIKFIELAAIPLFIWTWTLMYISFGITKTQATIRNDHINYEKLLKGPGARPLVPNYYFFPLFRRNDMFDFHSGSMAGWFGVTQVQLQKGIDYDYSVIRTGNPVPMVLSKEFSDARILVRAPSWKTKGNGTIIFETTSNIHGKKIVLSYYPERARVPIEIEMSPVTLYLSGKYYAGRTLKEMPTLTNVRVFSR